MYKEFTLDESSLPEPSAGPMFTPEQEKRLEIMMSRRLHPEERDRLERLLLGRLKKHKAELEEMLQLLSGHWTYEDHFYRYYHASWKVFGTQTTPGRAVTLLRKLLPERELNLTFEDILAEGTGQEFESNQDWDRVTRPILEAFCHAKFMIEMAVRYAGLPQPPQPMPSGYAALLYL